jgi:hypothetical protein
MLQRSGRVDVDSRLFDFRTGLSEGDHDLGVPVYVVHEQIPHAFRVISIAAPPQSNTGR